MKILFDNGTPNPIASSLAGHPIKTFDTSRTLQGGR